MPPPQPPASSTNAQQRRDAWAWATLVGLLLAAAVELFGLVTHMHRASLLQGAVNHTAYMSEADATLADGRVQLAEALSLLVLLVVGVAFITWMYRAVSRLNDEEPDVFRHGPGWAIGGWFVPFLNFARPKQMIDDAWRAATGSRHREQVPVILHAWWVCWIVAGLASGVGSRAFNGNTPAGFIDADHEAAVAHALTTLAALLAVAVVWIVSSAVMRPRASDPATAVSGIAPVGYRFNPPPGWPAPPPNGAPTPGWQPDPAWPPAPPGWDFWRKTRRLSAPTTPD